MSNKYNQRTVYAGQDKNNNWVWFIDPKDKNYSNIKTIKYEPKTVQQIESEYKIKITPL